MIRSQLDSRDAQQLTPGFMKASPVITCSLISYVKEGCHLQRFQQPSTLFFIFFSRRKCPPSPVLWSHTVQQHVFLSRMRQGIIKYINMMWLYASWISSERSHNLMTFSAPAIYLFIYFFKDVTAKSHPAASSQGCDIHGMLTHVLLSSPTLFFCAA